MPISAVMVRCRATRRSARSSMGAAAAASMSISTPLKISIIPLSVATTRACPSTRRFPYWRASAACSLTASSGFPRIWPADLYMPANASSRAESAATSAAGLTGLASATRLAGTSRQWTVHRRSRRREPNTRWRVGQPLAIVRAAAWRAPVMSWGTVSSRRGIAPPRGAVPLHSTISASVITPEEFARK
jgi:hypothetical protein